MEASRPTSYYNPSHQYRKPIQQATPKFSGLLDGLSHIVGVVDSNRLLELMASDGIGMIVPRTAMAYAKRGPDDGRETFLREFSGLIGNVLITGWFGWGMLKLLGNRVNAYNPHGLALDAHINAANLDAFNQLYHKALAETQDIDKARSSFVQKTLGSMVSDNPQFMWGAQQEGLQKIQNPEQRLKFLEENLTQILGQNEAKKALEQVKDQPYDVQLKSLGAKLDQQNGKLSPEAIKTLAELFEPGPVAKKPDAGTRKLDTDAEARIAQWNDPKTELINNAKQKARQQKEFLRTRLDLYKDTKQATEAFTRLVDDEALSHGITGTVHLEDNGQRLSAFQSRKNVLRELKHYLEHYIDRAAYDVNKAADGSVSKIDQLENRLFGKAESGFLRSLLPKAEDGLITAAVKHKHALTWIPVALALGSAGLFTFYNQYITAQKHGGHMFFPGEGNLQSQSNRSKSPLLAPTPPQQNFRPAAGFQQPSINGGILA